MNTMTFEKLQYQELKEIVKSHCVSELGKQLMDKLQPSTSLKTVKNRLKETTEARRLLDAEKSLPLSGVSGIGRVIEKLEKGMILEPEELMRVSDFLKGCRKVKQYMVDKEFFASLLSSYAHSMKELTGIEEKINFAIKAGKVDTAASKELKRIRRHIEGTEAKISEQLAKFLRNGKNKEYIQDFFISKKGDRYTIPIKASYKNHVGGTIVETSSKGSTVFIEPASITKLNAELAILKAEEEVEEYQILAFLTGLVLEKLADIHINLELISQYDMVFAKAKYSKQADGIEPKINDYGYIHLKGANHPLLTGKIVPLHFEIGENYRSLIITGPNAGGKTVVLKTIGLLTLATMLGFHITADEGTEIALFEHIFVDIGDNQSIENALSTFSSHMKNISAILQKATNNTLLLFDEIGSGTEPNEGAALAIAILEKFYHMGCITVATTHYGEIKRFSEIHPDFMNAAMQFNSKTLEPLYQLLIGTSGESNALWISKKMKVEEEILQKAKFYMESKSYDTEVVRENKIKKPTILKEKKKDRVEYQIGDRVKLLDYENHAIVYKSKDNTNNIVVLYQNELIEVNVKRVALEIKAAELYPEGYDLNSLFISYKDRKEQHDLQRGSKKALRKIEKDIRENS
ncbi:endonuclease MutS2 [Priestia sp. TSO9]|uniref:endonuclease MutS2 n=1 Tax=Priestia TaxID=2800373 RepID=UPI001E33DB9B|nr:endonuclease MutS2 [Priestia sp. TSO9]